MHDSELQITDKLGCIKLAHGLQVSALPTHGMMVTGQCYGVQDDAEGDNVSKAVPRAFIFHEHLQLLSPLEGLAIRFARHDDLLPIG